MAAGIGAQGTATIFAGADLRNAFHTGAVTWDGTTVKLYLDGAEVYSAAQSGAVNTTVDMFKGALNANGTAAGFWQGRIEHAIAIDRVLTPAEITNITNFWSA
jgi:beta-glucanase (GH16 family)